MFPYPRRVSVDRACTIVANALQAQSLRASPASVPAAAPACTSATPKATQRLTSSPATRRVQRCPASFSRPGADPPPAETLRRLTAERSLQRMRGHNVLHPMGWDAFGLPAEQYAIDTGTHPAITTRTNVNRFRQQLKVRPRPVVCGFQGHLSWDKRRAGRRALLRGGACAQQAADCALCDNFHVTLGCPAALQPAPAAPAARAGTPILPAATWPRQLVASLRRL